MLGKKREKDEKELKVERIEPESEEVEHEPEYEEINYVDPSLEDLQRAQSELDQVTKKMKSLKEEEKKLDNILKGTKAKELLNNFKIPRDEFVFKVTYDNGEFYEKAAKNYLNAILKRLCFVQTKSELEIIDYKCLLDYLWFKTNRKIKVSWLVKKSKPNDNFQSHTITQLRASHFFEDI